MKIVLALIILMSTNIYPENIHISLLISGDNFGVFNKLPEKFRFVETTLKRRDIIYTVNAGNNYSNEYYEVNHVFDKFYSELDFDINFIGRREYFSGNYPIGVSLNIDDKGVIPYKVINKPNFNIIFTGITDGYSRQRLNLVDYWTELAKLMYKITDNSDVIILISDLRREENIEILQEFKDISLIIESGYEQYDSSVYEKNYKYIVPAQDFTLVDLTFNKESNRVTERNIDGYSLKRVFLENYSILENYGETKQQELENIVEELNEKIARIDNEIVGFSNKYFYKSMVKYSKNISILDKIGEIAMINYDADRVMFFYDTLLEDIPAGLYSRQELKDVFKVDDLLIVEMNKDVYERLVNYSYIFGENYSDIENGVRVLTTESIFGKVRFDEISVIEYIDENLKSFIMRYVNGY